MSTCDFVSKIVNPEQIAYIMTRSFDELMILYDLIGSKRDMTISTDSESPSANFILEMDSEEDANNLFKSLNNTYFSVYKDRFAIEMSLSGRSISTVIYKAIS